MPAPTHTSEFRFIDSAGESRHLIVHIFRSSLPDVSPKESPAWGFLDGALIILAFDFASKSFGFRFESREISFSIALISDFVGTHWELKCGAATVRGEKMAPQPSSSLELVDSYIPNRFLGRREIDRTLHFLGADYLSQTILEGHRKENRAPSEMTDAPIWRDCDLLVMAPSAELPPRCIKTNTLTRIRQSVRLREDVPWFRNAFECLLALLLPVVWAIIVAVRTFRAKVVQLDVPVCEAAAHIARRQLVLGTCILVLAVPVCVAYIAFLFSILGSVGGLIGAVFYILLLGVGAFFRARGASLGLQLASLSNEHIAIRGVSAAFLLPFDESDHYLTNRAEPSRAANPPPSDR